MAKAGSRIKITLRCSECKQRNYNTMKNKKNSPEKLEMNTDKKLGFFKRVAKWFREMKSELKKVVWPTPKQFGKNTLVALVVMAAAALVLWGFDSLAKAAVEALITLV